MNHQPPVPFFPNNRFNNPMLNNSYNLASASTSAAASMATEMLATHNQTMIMKNHNKENLYHGYGGMQLQQQQAQQLQQQQQQLAAHSQTKFAALTANMCATASSASANVATLTANSTGTAGMTQASTAMVASSATCASQCSAAKLYERRQQQSTGLQYLNCNSFGYGLLSEFYEPPKPDTPPSRNIPYWIDPIWTSDSAPTEKDPSTAVTELLNIPLPELKTYNKLPIILTPYVLSLAKGSSFSFDLDKSKQI